jgi:hypothetical protein
LKKSQWTLKQRPVGKVKVGQDKNAFLLEEKELVSKHQPPLQ